MTIHDSAGKPLGGAASDGGLQIDRRSLLLGAGTAATIGINVADTSEAKAAVGSPGARIDAHTHFTPLKFLDFAEKAEGRPFGLSPLLRSKPALTAVQPRIDLLDHNGIDVNVLVPVPWIEGFHKVFADPALATQATKLTNDELAAVIATHPKRFRGVAILPVVDPDAMVAELHRAVSQLGFVGAYVAVGPTAKRMDHPDYEHLYKAIVELTPKNAPGGRGAMMWINRSEVLINWGYCLRRGQAISAMGLGCAKTKSDLVVMPSGRQNFRLFLLSA